MDSQSRLALHPSPSGNNLLPLKDNTCGYKSSEAILKALTVVDLYRRVRYAFEFLLDHLNGGYCPNVSGEAACQAQSPKLVGSGTDELTASAFLVCNWHVPSL